MTDAPDPIQAQTADGVIHQFPAGTPDAVVDKAIHDYMATTPQPKVSAPPPAPPQSTAYQNSAKTAQQMAGGLGNVTTSVLNGLTFNNADRVQGAMAAGGAAIRNFFGDKSVNPADAYAATRDVVRQDETQFAKTHPVSNFALNMVGGAPLGEGVGGLIGKAATPLAAVGRSVAAGGAVGAAYGAGGDKANPVMGAVQGGAIGAATGGAVPIVAQGARSLVSGVPKVGEALFGTTRQALAPDQERLVQMGTQLTPGQAMGGAAKVIEDAATSTPIIGPAIIAARQNANATFNKGILNQALGKIGQQLSDATDAGHAAIKEAGDRIGAAYDAALPKGGVTADPQLTTDLGNLSQVQGTMTQDAKDRAASFIQSRLQSRLDANGNLSGESYQAVQSDLKREIAMQGKRGDPDGIGQSLQTVSDSLQDAARRQNPRFAVQLDKADAAWALLTRAEKAAGMAGADGGVFTPAQYANAVRTGDNTIRNRGFARGDALGQATADAAKNVMSSKIPDSGTATRAGLATILGGGGAALAGGAPGLVGAVAGLGAGRVAYKAANSAAQRYLARPVAAAAQASTKSINQAMGSTTARLTGQAQQGAAQLAAPRQDAIGIQYVLPDGTLSAPQ